MTDIAPFLPKDFIETADGLLFAVVAPGTENGKVLSFLRYVREADGWKKYPTEAANHYLQQHHDEYLHYSPRLDASLHGVALAHICRHHQPRLRLQQLMQGPPRDAVEADLQRLCQLLQQHNLDLCQWGVTGSILAGVHHLGSDIDLVCYDRAAFQLGRAVVRELIAQKDLADLSATDWHNAYQRRAADLSFDEYLWHERRKFNKALVNGRKFDLSLLDHPDDTHGTCQKHGTWQLRCRIVDDQYGFDYPARFVTDDARVKTLVSYTATYTGQAFNGEYVEAVGLLEDDGSGGMRLVIGSSREAKGQYLKVLATP